MLVFTHTCPQCHAYLGKYAGNNSMDHSESVLNSTVTVNRF
jgi:hypothetical protein